jgi:hypothetical protein
LGLPTWDYQVSDWQSEPPQLPSSHGTQGYEFWYFYCDIPRLSTVTPHSTQKSVQKFCTIEFSFVSLINTPSVSSEQRNQILFN